MIFKYLCKIFVPRSKGSLIVSMKVMWESSLLLGKNIVRSAGKKNSSKA